MLTTEQKAVVKADILAAPDLSIYPENSDGSWAIADLYNLPASPEVKVWNTRAPISAIYDAIVWANFTPNDAADGTALYTNRLLAIQTKQMNLQSMIQGRETIDASKANVRAGLRDAVVSIPSGAAGAAVSAGGVSGVNVMNALTRPATRLEALLASGPVQTGTVSAGVMGHEGGVNYQQIDLARFW